MIVGPGNITDVTGPDPKIQKLIADIVEQNSKIIVQNEMIIGWLTTTHVLIKDAPDD